MYICLRTLLLGALPTFAKLAPLAKEQKPYYVPSGPATTPVKDSYIVMFDDNHNLEDHYNNTGINISASSGSFSHFRYLRGYRAVITNPEIIHKYVRRDPGVLFVEQNSLHKIESETQEEPVEDVAPQSRRRSTLSKRWTWAQRKNKQHWWTTTDKNWMMAAGTREKNSLRTMEDAGHGVNVYVVDTGVNANKQLDPDRLSWLGARNQYQCTPYCPKVGNAGDDPDDCPMDRRAADHDGHGTGCAVIIGGKDVGVAPSVNIISVKTICDDLTSAAYTVQALEDILERETLFAQEKKGTGVRAIVNFSQTIKVQKGQPVSSLLPETFKRLKDSGIMILTSAGNKLRKEEEDLERIPPSFESVYVVGNQGQNHAKHHTSSCSPNIDIWAPGEKVLTMNKVGKWVRKTGTSVAAPWVSGMAALVWGYESHTIRGVDVVWERIKQNGNASGVLNVPDDTTKLMFQTGANHPKRQPQHPYAFVGGEGYYDNTP